MATPAPETAPTKVLVVDDEEGIRQALDRFLSRLGYQVVQAGSAAEALDRQAAESPHAMLSDIRMPSMTGVELVPKALAHDSDLAIIMLTAIDEPRTAIECLKLGAYDYLIKPVDLDELEMSLQGALRQRQLEIERRELEQWLAREVAVARGTWRSIPRRSRRSPWMRSRRPGTGRRSGPRSRSWRTHWRVRSTRSSSKSASAAARSSRPAPSPHTPRSV